jgi:HD-like signal output (HDOD) protein
MTPVGALLENADLISAHDVSRALERQAREGGRMLRNLFALGAISRGALYRFLASQGVPTLSPLNYRVGSDVLELLPPEFIVQHEMMPVDRMGPMMTVVMLYPWDEDAIRAAESLTGLRISAFLCDADEFSTAYHRFFSRSLDEDIACGITEIDSKLDVPVPSTQSYDLNTLRTDVSGITDLPVLASTINRISHIEDLSPERLIECIAQDVAAAAIVLRDANRLRKNDAEPILRIDDAVQALGRDEAREAVLSAPVLAKSSARITEEYIRVQRESVAIAGLAQTLATSCGDEIVNAPYEVALLASVGRLALIELVRRECDGAKDDDHSDRSREVIDAISKTDYAATGAQLATAWGLPKVFVESIRQIRTPALARQYRKTAALVQLADSMVGRTNAILENDCENALETLECSTVAIQRALWPAAQYKSMNITPIMTAFA